LTQPTPRQKSTPRPTATTTEAAMARVPFMAVGSPVSLLRAKSVNPTMIGIQKKKPRRLTTIFHRRNPAAETAWARHSAQ